MSTAGELSWWVVNGDRWDFDEVFLGSDSITTAKHRKKSQLHRAPLHTLTIDLGLHQYVLS